MNDSGGKLWLNLQRLLLVYMIIAEIILFVLMLSKNFIAAMLLIPLIVVTILFKFYTGRKNYSDTVINHLPIEMSAAIDDASKQQRAGAKDESLKNAYLQPSLKTGSMLPDNYHLINEEIGQKDYVSEVS
jgi:c-di-AMP phosphodiesterase-like protein